MVLIFLVAMIWSSSEAASYRAPLYVPRSIRLLLCLSHRQHINLVLTYLLLIRLVDPKFIT